MAKLIFGCGYLGQWVARLWLAEGETVYAVTRSAEKAKSLATEGIRPILGNLVTDRAISLPVDIRTVLFAVGYDRSSAAPIQEVYAGGVERAIDALSEPIERFIYISSTGVYGSVSGEEVDETSPCKPQRTGGIASLAAEEALQKSKLQSRAVILRLAGIYGPGRIPRSADLIAGRPIDAPSCGWLNLIHVEDAGGIVLLADKLAPVPRTYVVSDGQPVRRAEYYAELARLLKAPAPTFIDPPASSPAAARAASDKRIVPGRMFEELRPTLKYPSYRDGLTAIVASDGVWGVSSGTQVA